MTTPNRATTDPVPCGPIRGIILGVGPTKPDGLRNGKGPGRLPGEPSPILSRVGPGAATTPSRVLNPTPYSIPKGQVCRGTI